MSPGSNSFTPLNTYLVRHTVAGVKVHDARLIASMKVYGITHLLTFNTEDFTRSHALDNPTTRTRWLWVSAM
jgi:hypothetical protein